MAVMALAPMNHFNMDEDFYEEDDEQEGEEEQDETLHYFGGLFRRDANERETFLENFAKAAKSWATKQDDLCSNALVRAHLPTVLRLSINSPYREIRESLSKLLKELEVGSINL